MVLDGKVQGVDFTVGYVWCRVLSCNLGVRCVEVGGVMSCYNEPGRVF